MASESSVPRQYVNNWTENDVLFGQGRGYYNRPGTKHLRTVIRQQLPQYAVADPKTRTLLIDKILHDMGAKRPPSRFLKVDKDANRWYELPRYAAVVKIRRDFANLKAIQKKQQIDNEQNQTHAIIPEAEASEAGNTDDHITTSADFIWTMDVFRPFVECTLDEWKEGMLFQETGLRSTDTILRQGAAAPKRNNYRHPYNWILNVIVKKIKKVYSLDKDARKTMVQMLRSQNEELKTMIWARQNNQSNMQTKESVAQEESAVDAINEAKVPQAAEVQTETKGVDIQEEKALLPHGSTSERAKATNKIQHTTTTNKSGNSRKRDAPHDKETAPLEKKRCPVVEDVAHESVETDNSELKQRLDDVQRLLDEGLVELGKFDSLFEETTKKVKHLESQMEAERNI